MESFTEHEPRMVVTCNQFTTKQQSKSKDSISRRNVQAKADVKKAKDGRKKRRRMLPSDYCKLEHVVNMTSKRINTKSPPIDLVNEYYPFVDFKFVFPDISPQVDKVSKIFIIVLVNSGAKGERFRENRKAIRETWGNERNCEQRKALEDKRLKDLKRILVFVVGKAGTETNDDELNMAEARKYNDMLIGNVTDNYLNNIIKLYMGLVWASGFDTKYILKTDDDVYVRLPRVMDYLVKAKLPTPFYGGSIVEFSPVQREIGNKWTISFKHYEKRCFPKYHAGAFFILSHDLLNKLFNYVYKRIPFHIDDAYVGLAMHDIGVNATDIPSFIIKGKTRMFFNKSMDCRVAGLVAFGHNIDSSFSKQFHRRIQKLVCEKGKVPVRCPKRKQKKKNMKKNMKKNATSSSTETMPSHRNDGNLKSITEKHK